MYNENQIVHQKGMFMARVINQDQILGMNIYLDRKNRTVYYSPITRRAYQVPPSDFKRFRAFKARYVTVLAGFMVMLILCSDWMKLPLWVPIVLSLVIWGVIEYFYYRFLNSLPPYPKFDKSKLKPSYEMSITREERNKAWLRIVLYVVVGVLLVINAYQLHYDFAMLAACYAAMILLCGYAIFSIWQLSKTTLKNPVTRR